MKTLVLSCDTGQGHNMAANAVCEALERIGAEHEMLDPLAAFCSDKTARGVTSIYNTMLRKMPGAFGVIYKAGDIYSSTGITSPVYTANAKYAEPLREYILSGDFGSVVATHLFPMLALTALKKQGFSAECFGVLTDYTCVPFFSETALDGYFIPHESLAGELAAKGLPAGRMYATGIPVSARFEAETTMAEARAALSLPQGAKIALVMSGGVGCGDPGAVCDALLEECGDICVCVLTGKNESLHDALSARYSGDSRVRIVPFTNEVALYMRASDVMISKPGGMTSTEACVAGVPLVILQVYAACETANAGFFESRGLAVCAKNAASAAAAAADILRDPKLGAEMRKAQHETIPPHAADRIAAKAVGKW